MLANDDSEIGASWGPVEYDFMFGFVLFLAEQHLAQIDIDQCLIDWHEHMMLPSLIAPLTSRGRALVRLIDSVQTELATAGRLAVPQYHGVAQEGLVTMHFTPSHRRRIALIREFRDAVRETPSEAT